MSRRAMVLATALAALAAPAALAGGAAAQSALDGPPAASGPQPLWVPDPEPPPEVEDVQPGFEVSAPVAVDSAAVEDPSRVAVAHWMAGLAREAGLPGELPVMAALVESGLRNLAYGDADSVGFFQMRQGIWNSGEYEGYLARPELQMRWFVAHAIAVRDARRAAGDVTYGEDPATWGEWIADVERPYAGYRGRYAPRLEEARTLLALPAPAIAPFELGLTVGGPAATQAADMLAARVLEDTEILLDERAAADLGAGRVDPRVSAVLLQAAARSPIAIWVMQTGHSYYTVHGNVSNHSFGRAVDIGSVGGEVVSPTNEAARELALALGRLPAGLRPTEIGTPWQISEPGYFTDSGHQDHLHVGFDDPLGVGDEEAAAAEPLGVATVPVAPRRVSPPAEPRFDAGAKGAGDAAAGNRVEPRFEVER